MAVNLLLAKEIPQSKQKLEILLTLSHIRFEWRKEEMSKNIASLADMRQS